MNAKNLPPNWLPRARLMMHNRPENRTAPVFAALPVFDADGFYRGARITGMSVEDRFPIDI